jgi:hypothetical protein
MEPIDFAGANVVVAKDQPPYKPLPSQFIGGKVGVLLCCWQLSDEEFEEVKRTRVIRNSIMTFDQPLQPHCLSADRPQWDIPQQNELFQQLREAVAEAKPEVRTELWKVVKVDQKGRHADEEVPEGNYLTEDAATDLARDLNTSRATDSVHYFKALPCGGS